MGSMDAKGPVKRVLIEATVIRADGTIDELGTIADSDKKWNYGPGRMLARWRIRQANRRHAHGNG